MKTAQINNATIYGQHEVIISFIQTNIMLHLSAGLGEQNLRLQLVANWQ